ncbi:MAG TPA: serine/threonine-protein kinase [Gemmataceae bacterium]|nr:serine/threonine-protein kinase [Gemmataceae bacterium]
MPGLCPDTLTLQSLLLGQLLGPESEGWETHLEQCSTCVTTAGTLTLCDPLTREARQAAAGPPPLVIAPAELPVVQRLAARARSLYTSGAPEQSAALHPGGLPFLAAPLLEGEIGRLGAYRVLRLLGAGAMGLVLLAEDERLRRAVALKVLHPRLADRPEAQARFLREARAMAAMAHEHIVPVYYVEETGAVPFLVMPVLSGLPLSDWLKRRPRPPLATVLRWAREIAEGLATAHERGLIHRDVKPSNLWVEGPNESLKILDFGLACFDREATRLTASGVIVGTPAYMAPEQARGAAPDPRSDLFSLGCVLYELCTGVTPFRGDSVMAVLSALANDEPAPVRSLNPALPIGVEVLVRRLLAKQPARRPASAREVADTIGRLEGMPPTPSRPRRLRWPAAAAAIVVIVTAAVGIWLSRRQSPAPPIAAEVRPQRDESNTPTPPTVDPQPSRSDRLVGHADAVTALAFPEGGKTLASASADGTIRLWTLATGADKIIVKHPAPCTAMILAADGRTLASAGRDGSVRIDDVATGEFLQTFTEKDGVSALAFGRNSLLYVATESTERGVVYWGLQSNFHDKIFFPDPGRAPMLAADPRGEMLVAAGDHKGSLYFRYLSPLGGREIVRAHNGPILGGAFSPDGGMLATVAGSPDDTIRLWDRKAIQREAVGFPLARIHALHPGGASAVAWAPDGRLIASAGMDGVVRVWDPITGADHAVFHHAPGAAVAVACLAFSPDGRLLASGGADKVIRLYDVPPLGDPSKP